jgi:hypothetical protein
LTPFSPIVFGVLSKKALLLETLYNRSYPHQI